MSTAGISAGEISIYTVYICGNLGSFKTKQQKNTNPTKENLSGSWLDPCGFEIFVFAWILSAYFGAGSHREEQEKCFGRTPRCSQAGFQRIRGLRCSSIPHSCAAGTQQSCTPAHLISWKVKPHNLHSGKPPMQLSRFSLIQERGVKAQLPGSPKRETCLHFFFFSLPFP